MWLADPVAVGARMARDATVIRTSIARRCPSAGRDAIMRTRAGVPTAGASAFKESDVEKDGCTFG